MQYVNLLGRWKDEADLEMFAKGIFEAMGVSFIEERQSSNYHEGRYFEGCGNGLAFMVSHSDEQGFDDLPFWIHVESSVFGRDEMVSIVEEAIYKKAIPCGFRLARIDDFGKRNQVRIDY